MKLFKTYLKEVGGNNKPNEIEGYFGHGIYVHLGHSLKADNIRRDSLIYTCPMKCEGDKIYDYPGNCPVCNMKFMLLQSN